MFLYIDPVGKAISTPLEPVVLKLKSPPLEARVSSIKCKNDLASSSVLLENFKLNFKLVPFTPFENFL